MKEEPTESFESPLEAVLSETPTEEPPADLKARCLQAVRDAEAAHAPKALAIWPIVWKSAAGLAAAFVIMVVAITVVQPRKAAMGYRPARTASAPTTRTAPPGAGMAKMAPEAEEAVRDRLGTSVDVEAKPAASSGLALDRSLGYSAGDVRAADAAAPADARMRARQPVAKDRMVSGLSRRGYAGDEVDMGVVAGTPFHDDNGDRPWRDDSGERQKITRKDMKVAVDDIEDAHERAASIITRAKGYVDTEEMRVNERGEGESVINARVPVEGLDGVVSQLRELGKVLELRGESEDRTNEYYARGQSIRELAEQEMQLVAKYEKEENRTRKRQLYYQIQAIRNQIRGQKGPLKELSNQTHFAFLSLVLTQAEGPRQFLHRLSQSVPTAGAWLAISAIFWVPVLLVVVAVWRRVAGRSKAI